MKPILNTFRVLKSRKINKLLSLQLIGLLLITIFPLSGCSQSKNKITNDELEKNIRLWQESKITNYNLILNKYMGTANYMPSLIQIRGGRVISNEMVGTKPMNIYLQIEDFETVEEAFETILKAYNKELPVKVTYNKEYGYPEKTIIDTRPDRTDHTMIIEITKFEVIKE